MSETFPNLPNSIKKFIPKPNLAPAPSYLQGENGGIERILNNEELEIEFDKLSKVAQLLVCEASVYRE